MDTTTPTLPAGIDVRPARPGDLPGLRAMVERCSPDTLHRRFHGVVGAGARRELERIAHPTDRHRSWVAVDDGGAVHGTSTLAWGRDGEVEVAFLVEDDHQRRGLGRALAGVAAEEARAAGVPQVEAIVQPDNRRALRFLRAVAPGLSMRFADGSTVATIALGPPAAAIPPLAPLAAPEAGAPAARREQAVPAAAALREGVAAARRPVPAAAAAVGAGGRPSPTGAAPAAPRPREAA